MKDKNILDWLKNQKSSIYNLPQWAEVIENCTHLKNQQFIISNQDKIVGFYQLYEGKGSLLPSPFGDYADFVGKNEISERLVDKITKHCQQKCLNWKCYISQSLPNIKADENYCSFSLDTTVSYAEILKNKYHKKTRNMVRKAQKLDIEVDHKMNLKAFYKLYLKTMKKLRFLPIPMKVFIKTQKTFVAESVFYRAYFQNQDLAYIWAFVWDKTLWIWQNVSDNNFSGMGINYALYNQAIEDACKNPYINQISFGSSQKDSQQAFFKKRWGAETIQLYKYGEQKQLNLQKKLSVIIKHLPLWMLEFAGNLAYKIYF